MWTRKKAAMPILLCVWCEHARSYCYLFSCQSCVYLTGFLFLSLYLWLCWIGCSFIVIFSLALSCLDHVLFSFFSFSCLQVISCSLRSLVSFWGSQFSNTHLFLAQLFWVVLNIRSGWPTYPSWFCQRTDKKRIPFTVVHYAENPTVQNDAVLSYFMQEKKPFRSFMLTENVPQVQYKKERKKDNSDKTWKDKVWSASSHCTLKFDAVSVLTEHAGQNEKVYNASILMTLFFEI